MTPQHLQQSDQYHEALLHARLRAIVSYGWGILSVQFDERALAAGQLKLLKCHGLFPDGTPFFIGDRGKDSTEARPVEGAFPAALEELDVFLAVPDQRENAANVSLDASNVSPSVRFVAQTTMVPDLNNGRNETQITWARENLRLLFGTEVRDAVQAVRIGRLVRDRTGAIVIRKKFVPSILRIDASEHLMDALRRVLSALIGRQKSLSEGRAARTAAAVDFQASDTARFWLLHTMNSFIPIVSHMVDHGDTHPEDCFIVLGNLIGQLCTFSTDGDPTKIPKFNYLELTEVFAPMIERAVAMINGALPENYMIIPLEKREDGMYLGQFEDPKIPRTHELFLEAMGIDEATLRERLPRLLKVGSWGHDSIHSERVYTRRPCRD